MIDNNFIVYYHKNKVNGKMYFGITCRSFEKRCGHNGCNYRSSPIFYNAIQKYGWNNFEHVIIYQNLTKDEACKIERELIINNQSYDINFGYNIELGGNHIGKHSDSTKKKIAESKIGIKRDDATKEKISKTLTGNTGSKNGKSKKVICLNDGNVFESMRLCGFYYKIDQGDISRCCNNHIKQIKGHNFMFYDEYSNLE